MNTLLIIFTLLYISSWLGCHAMVLYYVVTGADEENRIKMIVLLVGGVIPLYNTYLAHKCVIKKLMAGL